ncbi:MAG: dethiobiotin synthase [Helicobacteraceae bacterium]|nr:dethiobiotin synthase [Helicobacteraceae bacterium]
MYKTLFITATNTNVGKTYTTLKLLELYASKGLRVGVFKPFETGVDPIAEDATKLFEKALELNPVLSELSLSDITPYQFKLPAAPYIANDKNIEIDIELIKEKLNKIGSLCDIVLIEGAGGLLVPITKDFFVIDLILELNLFTLLITHSNLGCINDTLLSLEALKNRNIKHNFAINIKENEESFSKTSLKFFQNYCEDLYIVNTNLDKLVEKIDL